MTNLPVSGFFRVTCEYKRLNTDKLKWAAGYHTGIDIVSDNKKVYSTCDGIVYKSSYDKSYGRYVVIKDKQNRFHWFCHLECYFVKEFTKVTRTTVIGIMGKSGNVTGLHLHYEIRKECNCYGQVLNPAEYMGIPNKVGTYHSNNYNIEDFKQGQIIKIRCKFTGAVEGQTSLIETEGRQFFIYDSSLLENKTLVKAIICFVDTEKLLIEVDSVTNENKQFWIDKKEVVK